MQSTPTLPIHGTPSFMGAFTPPVPPLPDDLPHTTSPIADVFTSYRGTSNTTKPLPPIQNPVRSSLSEESLVLVGQQSPVRIKTRLPESSVRDTSSDNFKTSSNHVKQRSMSVGEIESKKAMVESSLASPPSKRLQNGENRGWDITLNGILSDFKGELSQLDPITGSLELRDPSTPARRVAPSRSKANALVFPYTANQDRRTPTLTLQPAPSMEADEVKQSRSAARNSSTTEAPPIVPPRSSSLTPTRSGSGSSQLNSPQTSTERHAPHPLRSTNGFTHAHSGSRDSAQLRTHHRSSASSSEPCLIPVGVEARIREPFPPTV